MKRNRIGQLVFVGTFLLALGLYALTIPAGLPWNGSTHLALQYLGVLPKSGSLPHPFWGYFVQIFGGSIPLACTMVALGAGLLGVVVNRYLGWRLGVSAALIWIFFPLNWYGAITGDRKAVLISLLIAVVWLGNAIFLGVMKKGRQIHQANVQQGLTAQATATFQTSQKRARINRWAGWGAMGIAVIVLLASVSTHDYQRGEPASVYAQGIVEDAAGRTILLNGIADDQVQMAALPEKNTLTLSNDENTRSNLVIWAKEKWLSETNLWLSAHVSPAAFAEAAFKLHPQQFYLMTGKTTTWDGWEKRWNAFKPYVKSTDPFTAPACRAFAHEANAIANELDDAAAWPIYWRIFNEVDPGNPAALINMVERQRRGYVVSDKEKARIQKELDAFFKDAWKRKHARELVAAAGPIRPDQDLLAKLAETAKKQYAEKVAKGEEIAASPELLSLVEWNNNMVGAMEKGDIVKAGRLARTILSNEKWKTFIPANAMMGSVSAYEGDYVASEAFFRTALDTTNKIPVLVFNDFADTLMHLKKYDEAEKMARRAVSEGGENFWLGRLTLLEILIEANRAEAEQKKLFDFLARTMPVKARAQLRKLQRKAEENAKKAKEGAKK